MLFPTSLKRFEEVSKKIKFINWLNWLEKLFSRKRILVDTDSCAYGKDHLVSKVRKVGGGWMFYSLGCSGCPMSRQEIKRFRQHKKVSKLAPNCMLLKSPLFSNKEIKDGEIFSLPVNITTPSIQEKSKTWIDNIMLPKPPVDINEPNPPPGGLVIDNNEEEEYSEDEE